ncbi:MAG: hypothetical protein ORN98_02000 [Alphaproteobacteria bacterium]|nr:hypothetical protein [Alphaproteobacteria bacterium]
MLSQKIHTLFTSMLGCLLLTLLAGCGGSSKQYAKLHPISEGGNFGYSEKWVSDTHIILLYTSKLERTKKPLEAAENKANIERIGDESARLALLRAAQLAQSRHYDYIRVNKQAAQIESSQFSSSGLNGAPPPATMGGGYADKNGVFHSIAAPTGSVVAKYGTGTSPRHEGYGYQIKSAADIEFLSALPDGQKDDGTVLSVKAILREGKVYLDEVEMLAKP